ncbi:unnamed protein product [Pleuronectes platessa]|uniref:Uncharacterized protein n=1 Tax=Pleuronectes platessa TaxID=8262 RepID=A0A9N7YGU3_PLEPL|nr:unnamed protein product [Pleuronectes platessa]
MPGDYRGASWLKVVFRGRLTSQGIRGSQEGENTVLDDASGCLAFFHVSPLCCVVTSPLFPLFLEFLLWPFKLRRFRGLPGYILSGRGFAAQLSGLSFSRLAALVPFDQSAPGA